MENRLKGLKKAMKATAFQDLQFTEEQRQAIRNEVQQEQAIHALLQLLVKEKTGVQLLPLLLARGLKQFEGSEGSLYVLLHELEAKEYVTSHWDEGGVKWYVLGKKGWALIGDGKSLPFLHRLKALYGGGSL